MYKPLVGVVILNWNRLDLTKDCLESLAKQTYEDILPVVIDNGSTDGSVAWLGEQEGLELIENPRNFGFARALNQGIELALSEDCEFVVSLNNDTVLDKEWLKTLVTYMENHPDVGFAQGASMQKGHPKLFDSSGIYLERGFIPNQRASGSEDPRLDIPAIGPNAAGSIYRAEMLEAARHQPGEYFDRRFFAYVEDVDFNLRCSLRGYQFGFEPKAKLYHIGSATGNKVAKKKMYWGARNLVWLIYKNASFKVFRQTWRIILKSHLANLQFLWRDQRHHFLSYLRGTCVGVLLLPLFWGKRRANLRAQTLSDEAFLELLVPSNPPLKNPLRRLTNLLK
jgi:GT2 family glycosyltransferase